MKILHYSLFLLAMAMESNAFSGSTTIRNQNMVSWTQTTPRGMISEASSPATHTFSKRQNSNHPLFSIHGTNLPERQSLKTKLQLTLAILCRRVSQLFQIRNIRLSLAMLLTACVLQFGGPTTISPMPANAAAAAAAKTTVRGKPKKVAASEPTKSKGDVTKQRAVVAAGFGASLYTVKTYRDRGWGTMDDDDDDDNDNEKSQVVEPTTTVETKTKEEEEEDPTTTSIESAMISSDDSASPSTTTATSSDDTALTNNNNNDDENNPIIKFLDAVGANPEVVFGFLGSSLSFIVSEDLLISGITFAWIFKLFKESEEKEFTEEELAEEEDDDDENDDEIIMDFKTMEDYRPEELMATEATTTEDVSDEPSITEEEVVAEPEAIIEEEEEEEVVVEDIIEDTLIEVTPPVFTEEEEVVVEPKAIVEEAATVAEDIVEESIEEPIVTQPEPIIEEVVPEEMEPETMEEPVATQSKPVIVEEEEDIQLEEVVAEKIVEPSPPSLETTTSPSSSTTPTRMSLADRAYKVVMDLGLIEWDENRREKWNRD